MVSVDADKKHTIKLPWLVPALLAAALFGACNPDEMTTSSGAPTETETETEATIGEDSTSTTGGTTTSGGPSSSDGTSSDGDPLCTPGEEACECGPGESCEPGLVCLSGLCVDPMCPVASEGCPCGPDQACDDGLICLSDLCVDGSALCPFSGDGFCDEPFPCPAGTDDDCCATPEDGVCEEEGMGGECPLGSDWLDCGTCPYANDGYCDEPFLCDPGTDGDDCCATPQDGVCEEESMGGECPDGSDWYDCGFCPWENDLECDEPEGLDLCPEGSDPADCCATPNDGVCEEEGMGGECPPGSDWIDCGTCPFMDNGFCDEPFLCEPGTDGDDCCATQKDGICEEEGMGGDCPPPSDWLDCGYCPWENDFECDEPEGTGLCGDGTDPDDCA